jgi:hypothetical protein
MLSVKKGPQDNRKKGKRKKKFLDLDPDPQLDKMRIRNPAKVTPNYRLDWNNWKAKTTRMISEPIHCKKLRLGYDNNDTIWLTGYWKQNRHERIPENSGVVAGGHGMLLNGGSHQLLQLRQ